MTRGAQNSRRTAAGRRFEKGKSGNPGGRPKKRADLVERCQAAVDDEVVEAWIREVQKRGRDWVEASKLLAAYGYGRPTTRYEVAVGSSLEDLVMETMEPKANGATK